MFQDLLIQSGLSEKESLVYQVLLGLGITPANVIVKETLLKRSTVYDILATLEEKGLVTHDKKGTKTTFWAEHPSKLYEYLDNNVERMKSVRKSLDEALPKLESQYNLHLYKPVVSYYEGVDGIRRVFNDVYGPKQKDKMIWGCVDLEKADTVFPKYIVKELIPKRKHNGLQAMGVLVKSAQSEELKKSDREQLRKTILVEKRQFPLPGEIEVYEDKIAMMSFDKEKFVGIIIQNKDLAESMRSLFKLIYAHNEEWKDSYDELYNEIEK